MHIVSVSVHLDDRKATDDPHKHLREVEVGSSLGEGGTPEKWSPSVIYVNLADEERFPCIAMTVIYVGLRFFRGTVRQLF